MEIIEKIFDISTQQEEIIVRQATKEELAEHKKNQDAINKLIEVDNEKEAARARILEKLGLTADELKVLLG